MIIYTYKYINGNCGLDITWTFIIMSKETIINYDEMREIETREIFAMTKLSYKYCHIQIQIIIFV